ncbi:MAG: glycosyltransferase [Bacteroidetes bacterium]|nr:glycosyltransferase [Bacteroidota bacterium]
MKITLACYESLSMIHGGPRVQVLQTKNELEKLGVEVSLLDPWKPFGKGSADLVHLFAAHLATFHLASTFRSFDIPFVTSSIFFTKHPPAIIKATLTVNALLKRFRSGIWTNYEYTRQVCDWSRAVLPNTTDEGRLISEGMDIPATKVTVVPNGVEPRFEFGDPSLFIKKYGVKDFILNVGHIGPERKNMLNTIRALKQIDHPAVIIGKITDTPYARQCVAEANDAKNILLIPGFDNGSEMLASAYAASSLFALPSRFETPGIAALEAALAGARIVITPYGGTKDYFGELATYVEPSSVESIRFGITAALNAPVDPRIKQRMKDEFLWSRVAEKTLAVYRSVLP